MSNYADSAENGEWLQSRPAPPAGVWRTLWATPSAAGPRPLLIALSLQILGIFANGSEFLGTELVIWHAWCLHFGALDPGTIVENWGAQERTLWVQA